MYNEYYFDNRILEACGIVQELKDRLIGNGEVYLDKDGSMVMSNLPTERQRAMFYEAIQAVLLKLEDYGIHVVETEDVYTDAGNISAIYAMVDIATPMALLERVSTNIQLKETIANLIASDDILVEHYITNVIEYLYGAYEIAAKIEHLHDYRYIFTSTSEYVDALKLIAKHAHPEIPASTKLSEYIVRVMAHEDRAQRAYATITRVAGITSSQFTTWDNLLGGIPAHDVGFYPNANPSVCLFSEDTEFIHDHKISTPHHFEYYIAFGLDMTEDAMALIAAEYVDVEKETLIDICDKLNIDDIKRDRILELKNIGDS